MLIEEAIPGRDRRAAPPGFTMLELAVVLGIIALLASVMLPVFTERMASADATQVAMQLDNVKTAARTFKLDVGHWPLQISQLADPPGEGVAGRMDLLGNDIGGSAGWRGPYVDVATLPGDSFAIREGVVIESPFQMAEWGGEWYLAIPVSGLSREEVVRISELVDGDATIAPGLDEAGRIRWTGDRMLYLAEPVQRARPRPAEEAPDPEG